MSTPDMHSYSSEPNSKMGVSGRIAAFFQSAHITPLLALIALLLGVFAVLVTPREEEPQINVTMANVLIPFLGASVKDVERMVAMPAEQVLGQIADIEHVMSVSNPGMAVITVQYKVGVPRTEALVRLYDTLNSNADWLPQGLGVLPPIVKPKGIDDVPIVTLSLYSKNPQTDVHELERVANSLESELKRVDGTREVKTIGGSGRAVMVELDAARMAGSSVDVNVVRGALQSANMGASIGNLLGGKQTVYVETGAHLRNAQDVAELIVGVTNGNPVYLRDVANVRDGAPPPSHYVWYGQTAYDPSVANAAFGEYPAVTMSITKKQGANAIDVANQVMSRVEQLHNTVIPVDVSVAETRNYGATANDKAVKLIQKLIFATLSVVALVFFALGRREAAIVGAAVALTLMATLFASWAWGFTLNRVSLFALIFSIGILVDDAIVVVENIHRHQQLHPAKTLMQLIPGAVDEVGGPTILATLTVIAALLPMAFVSGLMGPYMSPIPINASMGMLLSLVIAFVVTPWMARLWLHKEPSHHVGLSGKLRPWFEKIFHPLLDVKNGAKNRCKLGLGIFGLITFSMLLPVLGLVQLKMLPFDNKSEFQIVVDMPAGTALEDTSAVLHELGAYLGTVPEVTNYQAYAGTAAPINFNGLVRQYYLRSGGEVGELIVNLQDKHHRSEKSHQIATRLRPELQKIGARYGANVKVVEVPPGPPVFAPIVAEVYGPDDAGRAQLAKQVREVFAKTESVVDVDDSTPASAPRTVLTVDRRKAALLGISQQSIVGTLHAGLAGEAAMYLRNHSKYPDSVTLQLPANQQGSLDALLQMTVRNAQGQSVPIRELVQVSDTLREAPIYHKDLLPVNFVVGDMAGKIDSPLYGMFGMRGDITKITTPDGGQLTDYFIRQPDDTYRGYSIKWDGEWQITYETFRDMGLAYGVGLILIYLLVVAQFGSYLTPLIIMAPIPLTIIGVMPGHALLGAQYTATSMIGMIALAGIIVRNSILLVDFIRLQTAQGMPLAQAIIESAITRAQPIMLTGLAAMMGAFFILDDPVFNGLSISLIFGIFVSTILTLVVIPLLYYVAYRKKHEVAKDVDI